MEIISTPRRPLVFVTGAVVLGICACYLFAPPAAVLIAGALAAGSALFASIRKGSAASFSAPRQTLRAWPQSAPAAAFRQTQWARLRPAPVAASNSNLATLSAAARALFASLIASLRALFASLLASPRTLFASVLTSPRAPFAFLLALVFCCAALYAHAAFAERDPLESAMQSGGDSSARIEGVVLTCHRQDSTRLTLTILRDDHRMILVRLRGNEGRLPASSDLVGARAGFHGTLSYPDTARNPGSFDYRLYLLSEDIRVIADGYAEMTVVSPAPFPWSAYHQIARAKYAFLDRLNQTLPPEQAALFAGMMFGGREGIDDETYAMFQRGGVAHILSVSGLHVAMVYAFVSAVLGKRRTKGFYFTTIGVLLFYAVLSEFSPTVVRAVLMIGFHIGAKLLHSRYDMLTGVCASALLMLLVRPLSLFGVGFQLSYLAVISLSFALPFLARFTGFRNRLTGRALTERERITALRKRPETLRRAAVFSYLLPAFVIQPFLAPVTAFRFHLISMSAFVVNLAVIALSALIVPFGLILFGMTTLAHALPAFAPALDYPSGALTSAAGFLVELMMSSVRAGDALPFGSFRVCAPPAAFVLFLYATLWFLMSDTFALLLYRRGETRAVGITSPNKQNASGIALRLPGILAAQIRALPRSITIAAPRLAALALACALCGLSPVCRTDTSAYTFVDVGQGDCLHIRTPDGRNYLVDGGGAEDYDVGGKVLLPYLWHNGVNRLDGVFVSHLHIDHFKGLCELAKEMRVDAWYVYAGSVGDKALAGAGAAGDTVYGLSAGDRVLLGGSGAFADALYPPAPAGSTGDIATNSSPSAKPAPEAIATNAASASGPSPGATTAAAATGATATQDDENSSCLILRFENEGLSVLMTGDLGTEGETALLETAGAKTDLQTDILKVAHHGSKYSSGEPFLDTVSPTAAVIQVGRNFYGHPTPETLAKLTARDIITYRNDLDGAVLIDPIPGGFRVRTVKRDFVSPVLWKNSERIRE